MTSPLVVLDTGVVVRALIGSEHASSFRVVRAAGTGEVRTALSDAFLTELIGVVRRRERQIRGPARAFEIALDLWQHGTFYRPVRREWPSIEDPGDGWMLDLAFESEADFVVSWDPHMTYARMPFPVEVLTPQLLLERLAALR